MTENNILTSLGNGNLTKYVKQLTIGGVFILVVAGYFTYVSPTIGENTKAIVIQKEQQKTVEQKLDKLILTTEKIHNDIQEFKNRQQGLELVITAAHSEDDKVKALIEILNRK